MFSIKIFNKFPLVLRPLNVTAKIILVMNPRDQEYKKPMFDIKVALEAISLNINRDQVNLLIILNIIYLIYQ